jgi:hypothetical protein
MEFDILSILDFQIVFTSAYRFLERFSKLVGSGKIYFDLAQYVTELALVDYKMLKYAPS